MKRKYIKWFVPALCFAAGATFLSGCTSDFEEFNTDPYGVSAQQLDADFKRFGEPIKQAQLSIYAYQPAWVTQLQQNLIADVYSGYMMPPTPFRGNTNNMNYDLVPGWNEWTWRVAYGNDFGTSVMAPTKSVIDLAGDKYPHFGAWAKILRVEAMHRVTDTYGPIVYRNYGNLNEDGSVSYESQEAVYDAFFEDLDDAITTLTPYVVNDSASAFTKFDLVYAGDYEKWVKFANTLRLRLAIRIAKVDPTKAKTEGEKALANTIGLMGSNGENFIVDMGATTHPLNVFNNSWDDIRMGAPMESILGGLSDPRLPKYFQPATDEAVTGEYKGIRQGINIDEKGRYSGYSKLTTFENRVILMTAAESKFLQAEAALRGWTGAGDDQALYESGVQLSLEQWGVGAGYDTYVNDAVSQPKQYLDPKSITATQNDVLVGNPNLSTVTVAWDDAAADAVKLEKIITQKWIATYPDGQEAWSEFRRTGYPKLFPVVINNSGGTINTNAQIKRIPFAANEYSTNPAGVESGIDLLGGPDTGGTSLWWDID